MKRFLLLKALLIPSVALTLLCSSSCSKEDKIEINNHLVEEIGSWVDVSKSNKFKMSQIVGDWVLDKVTCETYIDGKLTATEDNTSVRTEEYIFYDDGTMKYSGKWGLWTYAHNSIIWKWQGGLNHAEVVTVSKSKLVYRKEVLTIPLVFPLFYENKSGTHRFTVYEYKKK